MSLNDEQLDISLSLDSTLNVSAGAGTGKTHTLTYRIIKCIAKMIDEGIDYPIDRILAITFTDKAAKELKSRVRGALFQQARDTGEQIFYDCAINIDNAWISTMHSMASKILKQNALAFGIDPSFEVLQDSELDLIFEQAIDEVLDNLKNNEAPLIVELLSVVNLRKSRFPNVRSIEGNIKSLISSTQYMPNGLDGIRLANLELTPNQLLRELFESSFTLKDILENGEYSEANKKKAEEYIEELKIAHEFTNDWFKNSSDEGFLSPDLDIDTFVSVILSYPAMTPKFSSKGSDDFEIFELYREKYKRAVGELRASIGLRQASALLEIAKLVSRRINELKALNGTKLSQNDLLEVAYRKLKDPANTSMLKNYQDKFKFIMVDEFQDTDRLQMNLIRLLSNTSTDNLNNVCTVGDMQQSIYKFRGADVTLAKERFTLLCGTNSQKSLSQNYRSHKDILHAVEIFFKKQAFFGKDFLELSASRETDDELSLQIFADKPRAIFDFINFKDSDGAIKARKYSAIKIARHFKELKDKQVPCSSMALLLGNMSEADIFIKAFEHYDIQSVVTGGSVFGQTDEARLVESLLDYAVNTHEDIALFNILTSRLFNISDDILLSLVNGYSDGRRVSLSEGFEQASKLIHSNVEDSLDDKHIALKNAALCLEQYVKDTRQKSASEAIRQLSFSSGLLFRISNQVNPSKDRNSYTQAYEVKPEFISFIANWNKAINTVSTFEEDASGIAEIASKYTNYIDTVKESPGAIALKDSNFVSIMTVHKSKGLEFDHVAVACLGENNINPSEMLIDNIGDESFLGINASLNNFVDEDSKSHLDKINKRDYAPDYFNINSEEIDELEKDLIKTDSPMVVNNLLRSLYKLREEAEQKRLLYVAMTRAKESLYVSHISKGSIETKDGSGSLNGYSGIYKDVYDVILEHFRAPEEGFQIDVNVVEQPIRFRRTQLIEESLDKSDVEEINELFNADELKDDSFAMPKYKDHEVMQFEKTNFARADLYSYSSISKTKEDTKKENDKLSDQFDEDVVSSLHSGDSAVNLGTAFHHIAQIAIEDAKRKGAPYKLEVPNVDVVNAQEELEELSDNQKIRLNLAINRWFVSNIAKEFSAYENIFAEIPFTCYLEDEKDQGFYLEGEIDGLAFNNYDQAFLIDYKTGQMDQTDEELYGKHLFQAQCYAYALLKAEFKEVQANFVLVEQTDNEPNSKCQNKYDEESEPRVITYTFSSQDFDTLEQEIKHKKSNMCSN